MVILTLHIELAKHRMTQKDLSLLTGIRQPTISAYCNGTAKHLVIEHLDKICNALNCDISDIIVLKKD